MEREVIELEEGPDGVFREARRVKGPGKRKEPAPSAQKPSRFLLEGFAEAMRSSEDKELRRFMNGVDAGIEILERLSKIRKMFR